jgi:predicted DNA-binding protein with PD1-like motif
MVIQSAGIRRLVQVRLNPGDDVLLSLREVAQREKLGSAVILNGIGSLSRYHVHVVKTTNLPPGDVFWNGEEPLDILNITGFVIDGRVHAHITFSNTEVAMGGHMEEGCIVLTFSLITLAETPEASFTNWDQVGPLHP